MAVITCPKFLLARTVSRLAQAPRLLALALVSTLALTLGSLLAAAPAGALVAEVAGTKVGLQPPEVARWWDGGGKFTGLKTEGEANPAVLAFANKNGNPVVHSLRAYVVYWDPNNYYDGDWQELINGFMSSVASSGGQLANEFAVDTQYRDSTNQPAAGRVSFQGSYTDTNPYPSPGGCVDPHPFKFATTLQGTTLPVCLTDAQLRVQLQAFISQHGLPQGMGVIYYILTPPGVTLCLDGGGAEGQGHCSDYYLGTPLEVKTEEEAKVRPLEQIEKEENGEVAVENKRLQSYKRSLCSYHGAIGSGEPNTILYGAIPWTAGGFGSGEFAPDLLAYDCQDGGFEPDTKVGELLLKEKVHALTPKEKEEFAKKSPQEKREQEEAEAEGFQGPHQQEPHQLGSAFDLDGDHDKGLADLIINQIAVEQHNAVTDPLLNAWQDTNGREATDECRNFFLPVSGSSGVASPFTGAGSLFNQLFGANIYYLNDTFNMAAYRLSYPGIPCMQGVGLAPAFTSPVAVNSGELAGFNGMESDITLNATPSYPSLKETYPTFTWNFGDGTPTVTGFAPGAPAENSPGAAVCAAPWLAPCAASAFHAYQYGGTYLVSLTVVDVSGNTASVTHPVTVAGPPPPSPSGGSAGAGAGGASTGSTGSPGSTGPGAKHVPAVAAAVSTHSLRNALRKGLSVRYVVNERVTGRFEVLLAKSIANRIGLHGPAVSGLAPGTPPQIEIGRAFLVTNAGGRNSVTIKFSKSVAAHLKRLHGVSLLLRAIVRNAQGSATVISTVTLSR